MKHAAARETSRRDRVDAIRRIVPVAGSEGNEESLGQPLDVEAGRSRHLDESGTVDSPPLIPVRMKAGCRNAWRDEIDERIDGLDQNQRATAHGPHGLERAHRI